MKKIIFLTLVMILGMSSVSLGKSYLCISEKGRILDNWEVLKITEKKIIVKTEDNNERIESVKYFGSKNNYICRDGTDVMFKNFKSRVEKGKSVKGNTFLSCRLTYLKRFGSHIHTDFILDLKKMVFYFYFNNFMSGDEYGDFRIMRGKCGEV